MGWALTRNTTVRVLVSNSEGSRANLTIRTYMYSYQHSRHSLTSNMCHVYEHVTLGIVTWTPITSVHSITAYSTM